MIFSEQDTLPNGVTIPRLALGTWFLPDQQAAEAVKTALSIGYRHIDTAQAYGNEEGVGEGIRRSGIPREEIFVTSKVAAEHKSYATAAQSIQKPAAPLLYCICFKPAPPSLAAPPAGTGPPRPRRSA